MLRVYFSTFTHLYSHQIRQAFHVEMSQERFSTPIYRQALAKEFEIGQQLEHPNICRTIDLEKVDNTGHGSGDGDILTAIIWAAHQEECPPAELARKIAGRS